MNEKLKLPREAAEAIELMRAKGLTNTEIINNHHEKKHIDVKGWKYLYRFSIGELSNALYLGYETEDTPEERIKKEYLYRIEQSKCANYAIESQRYMYIADGIKFTLNELGIRIEGVNA